MTGTDPAAAALDISKWPTAQKFVVKCSEFLNEVQDLYVRPKTHIPQDPQYLSYPTPTRFASLLTTLARHKDPRQGS